jgi:hypothetical protein
MNVSNLINTLVTESVTTRKALMIASAGQENMEIHSIILARIKFHWGRGLRLVTLQYIFFPNIDVSAMY